MTVAARQGSDALLDAFEVAPAFLQTGASILIVDDERPLRGVLTRILENAGHVCREAADVNEARSALEEGAFDLVLSDVDMPGESGIDLLTYISVNHPDVATVMVTGVDDTDLANVALMTGAYGYVVKPFEANEIVINVSNALQRRRLEIENRTQRDRLEVAVQERTQELSDALEGLERSQRELRTSRAETVRRLSLAAESRDGETGQHIDRMSRYCAALVRKLGHDAEATETFRLAMAMHDIGKIGIPDRVLLKPGSLTDEEFEEMRRHAEFGHKILSGSGSDMLELAARIALTHHERWDGAGYPHGLAGEAIPFEGRVAAIGDVFDALTTDRVYRKAFPVDEAVRMMGAERGRHFDPEILDAFFEIIDEILEIREVALG